jgi:multimeric flavodoxin WrbA
MKVVAFNGSPRPNGNTSFLGSSYWNIAIGRQPGEVEKDEEGMTTMRVLGENMAWLLQQLHGKN